MPGIIRNYYADGNTARGFFSLYESNLEGLDRLYILKGGPGTGKSNLMKAIGMEWMNKGFDIELIHCSLDNHAIEGVIIPQLRVGIVDGSEPHIIEPKAPGAIEEYVNIGLAWDSAKLIQYKSEIVKLGNQKRDLLQLAYKSFAQALDIHDEWEKIYIENMDFYKANELTELLIRRLFADKTLCKKSAVRHRFLGSATPEGPVDFIQNLTVDIEKRYFIKGRPGTGKSTLLKKLASYAEQRGFDTEIYHCGFDPASLDMVIVRELGFAIFDSTSPHEYFPDRDTDQIVDIYEYAVTPGTDEKYAAGLRDIVQMYKEKVSEGTSLLAKAKILSDELKQIYEKAMDFEKVDSIRNAIHCEIENLTR